MNPRTLHVSSQYHFIFYDDFTTVQYLSSDDVPPTWSRLCRDSRELVTDAQFELAICWSMNEVEEAPDADHPGTMLNEGEVLPTAPKVSWAPGTFEDEGDVPSAGTPKLANLDELTCRRSSRN